MDTTRFDYIIVGAGSAGCVLANRLSADPVNRVLLIEAGGGDNHPYVRMPLGFLQALRIPALTWGYQTEPEPMVGNRRLPLPRGKLMGGSSSINGMIHFRGHPLDFDDWARAGCEGWSYKDVLPYFRRSEHHWSGGNAQRGADGPIAVSRIDTSRLLADELREAAQMCGIAATDDYDGTTNEGYAPIQVAIDKGNRSSSARAYLGPAVRARPNLTIVTKTKTRRIGFDGRRATHVEVETPTGPATYHAAREIILSAGTYNSPQLLMLSGVGPAADLAALGIPVVHDLPGVGQNLQEHPRVSHQYVAKMPFSFVGELRLDRAVLSFLKWWLLSRGTFSNQVVSGCILAKSRPDLDRPDLQLMVTPTRVDANIWVPGLHRAKDDCFYISICLLRPESRGQLTLASADPDAAPRVQLNLLTHGNDRATLIEGLRLSRRIFEAGPLSPYVREEMLPGAAVQSDADFAAAMPDISGIVHHPVGTCAMGSGALSVVDAALRVHGIERLRIADASVMPMMPGANTNAATVMIGEKAADLILSARV